ncbi:SpdD-like protein [Streptomyces sp. NPDC102360]|uniref:SpdD-like protein n=1 Tax=Streptomyces sp. NPDC102360 TaxID=3366160 RepID=UPI0037F889B8
MLRPKIPTMPAPTGHVTPPAVVEPTSVVPRHTPEPFASAPAPTRPTVQLTPGALALLVGGGTAAVLVVGTVLVSMLLAVAVTAGSLAIVALVVRSLIASEHKRR